MERPSKPLNISDQSSFEFVKECLKGDPTSGINFDRIQYDFSKSQYVIIEYLLCEEVQISKNITPYSSHPNRYFSKNKMKFISLWNFSKKINARLYLVNYAKKGTRFENQVLLMRMINLDLANTQPVKTKNKEMTKEEFSDWLRKLNSKGFE